MSNNGEERQDLLILVDDDGKEHEFALIDRIQIDLKEYLIMAPVVTLDDEDDKMIDVEDEAYILPC
ncbi:MAG: DUF1292 domain-containing protein [Bacillota bacterium]|nr:DUF1292 domain-containing protein [Bacillota bacterium]